MVTQLELFGDQPSVRPQPPRRREGSTAPHHQRRHADPSELLVRDGWADRQLAA
jgi:hypothetical protein